MKDEILLQLIKKSGAFLFTRIVGIVLGFALSWYIARRGGSELWGSFILAFSLLNIVVVFALIGLDTITVKYISESRDEKDRKSQILSQVLRGVFVISLVILGLLFLSLAYLGEFTQFMSLNRDELLMVSLAVPGLAFIRIISAYYRGEQNMVVHGALKNVLIFGSLLIIVLLTGELIQETITTIVLLKFLLIIIYSTSIIFMSRFILKGDFRLLSGVIKPNYSLVKEAFPLMLVASLALFTGYVDIFMLGYFVDESAVGIYDIAIKYSSVTAIFLAAINAYIMPKFASHYKHGRIGELASLVQKSSFLIALTTIPLLLILFTLSGFLMGLYGEEYLFGIVALRILIIAQMVSALCGSVAILLQMTNNQGTFQNIFLVATIINVILNFVLIPKYGITGAAVATLISTSLWNIGAACFAKIKLNILTVYWPTRVNY